MVYPPFGYGALFKMLDEKSCELIKGNVVHPVVLIHMSGTRNDIEFLRFGRQPVGVFAELAGVSALRLAEPMSHMLTVAMAFKHGSILATLVTKLSLPQIHLGYWL
jgi:hypothetical protein